MQIEEFAHRKNLKLKYLEGNGSRDEQVDMELRLRLIGKNNLSAHLGFVNPSSSSTLIVIVPCGKGKSLKDIYKQMDIKKWFAYVLVLYVILILVENFILLVTCRINAQSYRLRRENFLLNLCAFRAILGMSFPISQRASLSQRQLFLAMSVFGIVFSNFFSCKLSALFTTHPNRPQVTNFEELRASGLVVTVDPLTRGFIENELDADFFHRTLPRTETMNNTERSRLMLSFNTSYAFIVFKETWRHFSYFQHNIGRKAFCTSKDLTIVENLPRVFVLQNESPFLWPLTKFLMLLQEADITIHWAKGTIEATKKFLNITYPANFWSQAVPIQVEHLTWLGYLLCLGYGLATIVFIIERFYGARRNMN
ncbi:uncharacterized protein LOC108092771 [Drosophila ficusphila]|uniref:uncharacterized protein LOC108092771 n=1 Tax=Drosophila ficusphila TaxID=30025 RepID=UPI001C8AB931|nr:uncharacterized protein LOC108092771 [Drosophila ficusphila]